MRLDMACACASIGRRDRIPASLVEAIESAERATAAGRALELRIALDYSSREAILRASCWMMSSLEVSESEFSRRLARSLTPAPLRPTWIC